MPAAPLSPDHDLAWYHLILVHARATAAINARLVGDGRYLSLEHYDVLLALRRAPGSDHRLRLSELAEAVTLSRSGLTRLVDRLEKTGLLRREACPTDRRGAFAVLTPKGAAALRRTWPVYAGLIQEHFARHVSAEEAAVITRALGRVLRGFGAAAPAAGEPAAEPSGEAGAGTRTRPAVPPDNPGMGQVREA